MQNFDDNFLINIQWEKKIIPIHFVFNQIKNLWQKYMFFFVEKKILIRKAGIILQFSFSEVLIIYVLIRNN